MSPQEIRLFWARRGTTEDKFWARVEKGPDCWQWLGAISTWGYGFFRVDGKTRHAHRVSWEMHNGPIPEGLWVLHHCDNPPCVNPDHLFLGTAKTNVADMIAKGRRGHMRPRLRGEQHHAAKLSDAQVDEIRAALARGEIHRLIAARFGISRAYVGMLANGKRRTASELLAEVAQRS